MYISRRLGSPVRCSSVGLVLLAVLVSGIASCTSGHRPTRRTAARLDSGWPKGNEVFQQASYRKLQVAVPEVPGAEFVNDDDLCLSCHEAYVKNFAENVHRADSCESCHGPASRHLETRGKEPGLILSFKTMNACERSEVCLKCHEENQCSPGAKWRRSVHAHKGVACTDCHTSHYNVPEGTPATTEPGAAALHDPVADPWTVVRGQQPHARPSLAGTSNNLAAAAPYVCYQCHCDMRQYQEIAGPHQICGPNGFNCTTCHDPHGKIREGTRKDLCLQCHGDGGPVMAFHSSTHDLEGVACTDCHNPHPSTNVPRLVRVSHTSVQRAPRRQMSVDEPDACYKCHPKIFGMNAMPSHHPIREGKMTCSDCHDAHGQQEGNLKADTVNNLCYKCHAEKQGPFVYEHPVVTENCAYCHEPHGTVANNLLRQPVAFLCLRCHSGHRSSSKADIDNLSAPQTSFFTDCTQCHSQIHGSDLPSPWTRKRDFMR